MKEFSSLAGFARHFAKLAAIGEEVAHHAADRGGEIIEKTAKDKLGHYQESDGLFRAWAPLADSTEAKKKSMGAPLGAPGIMTGAMYASLERKTEGATSVVGTDDIHMVYFELGTKTQPARSVLGASAFESRPKLEIQVGAIVAAWVCGIGWKRPRLPGLQVQDETK